MKCSYRPVSEFKYACPVCGQHIKCDSSQSGSVMECPTCFQKITVPQAPATDDPKFIIAGTKVGGERPVPTAADSGPVTAPEKHFPIAVFVLAVLLCAAVAAAFVFRGKIFKPTETGTNQVTGASGETQTPAANKTNQAPPKPALVAPPANDTNWMLNLDAAAIPDSAAAGRIHGRNFICERAIWDGDTLTMRMPARDPTDLGLSIYLYTNQTAGLAGQAVSITSDTTNAPRVRLRWREDQQKNKTQDFHAGYALQIEFGQPAGNRLPGKMYLCTPDDEKSYVAGTFNAEIRKPKPPK
jgi:DNA-directed RNA polymerase subunit RPC12/RpoP